MQKTHKQTVNTRHILMLIVLMAGVNLCAQDTAGDQSNLFMYGVNLSTEYDDGAYVASNGGRGQVLYMVQPNINFEASRSRWKSTIRYLPGFTYSTQPKSSYDVISQSLGLVFSRRLSKRLTFDVQNNFTLTSNPFDTLRAASELPAVPIEDRPNTTISGTARSRRMEQALADLSYALDARSTLSLGGNFLHLTNRDSGSSLPGQAQISVSEAANFSYNRQLGPRSSTGFRYTFQRLDFEHGLVRTNSHSLVYLVSMALTPGVVVSGFAGPDYSVTRSQPGDASLPVSARSAQWTTVGGVTIGWARPLYGFNASATRQLADGGGARSNVRLNSFSAQANREISTRTSLRAFITYNNNNTLVSVLGTPGSFNYLAAGAGLERKVTQNCSLNLFYWRVRQNDERGSQSFISGNRVGITLAYAKKQPVGRP